MGSAHSASLPAVEQYGTEPLLLYFLQGMNESELHTQVRVRTSAEKTYKPNVLIYIVYMNYYQIKPYNNSMIYLTLKILIKSNRYTTDSLIEKKRNTHDIRINNEICI